MTDYTPWFEQTGPQGDLVLSSRIRLARNLKDERFPNRLSDDELFDVTQRLSDAFFSANSKMADEFTEVQIADLSRNEALSYVEKHLISEELLNRNRGTRVLLSKDKHLSIMLGEEDHIRIQCMRPGLDLESAYEEAVRVARIFEELLPVAWSDNYGFLTACPTNTGTGLRASLMVHLPMLTEMKLIPQTIQSLQKLGIAVRGAYGEHSKAQGSIYQISNQMTLGFSEEDLIADLTRVTAQLLAREKDLRAKAYQRHPLLIEDRVYRALALLRSSRRMSYEEAMNLLSDVRLGTDLNIVTDVCLDSLNRLISSVGPAAIAGNTGTGQNRLAGEQARAKLIRESLATSVPDSEQQSEDDEESAGKITHDAGEKTDPETAADTDPDESEHTDPTKDTDGSSKTGNAEDTQPSEDSQDTQDSEDNQDSEDKDDRTEQTNT